MPSSELRKLDDTTHPSRIRVRNDTCPSADALARHSPYSYGAQATLSTASEWNSCTCLRRHSVTLPTPQHPAGPVPLGRCTPCHLGQPEPGLRRTWGAPRPRGGWGPPSRRPEEPRVVAREAAAAPGATPVRPSLPSAGCRRSCRCVPCQCSSPVLGEAAFAAAGGTAAGGGEARRTAAPAGPCTNSIFEIADVGRYSMGLFSQNSPTRRTKFKCKMPVIFRKGSNVCSERTSGPTTRNERRVKSDRQREEEEETRRRWAEKKREQFFLEKSAQADSTKHGVECTGVCKGNCNISAHSLCLPYISDKEEAKQCAAQSNIFKNSAFASDCDAPILTRLLRFIGRM
ncbi:hypothetical protein GQ600_13352 [Phytophthora cactorum]|nr:hypothetical protein GQ600_13352 [Phytophthora cactorum]